MQDKENRDIVDSQGNVIKSIKDNKTKQFLKDNIWNILSTGLATSITLVEMINLVISKNFSVSCSNFYGIDGKYFDGTEMFENKLIFIFCALALFVYPFIFSYINKKMNSKLYVIFTFIITVYIMFFQNLSYTINLIEIIPWAWLRRFIDNYATIGVFLIVDIVIAYFIIIRNFFWKNKKYSVCGLGTVTDNVPAIVAASASVSVIDASGDLEAAYAEWGAVSNATGYNVYIKPAGGTRAQKLPVNI